MRYALPTSHEDILIIAMLESADAIENIDEILAVDGIDLFFIARVDLSKSLGFKGDKHHREVRAAVDRLIDRIRAAGRQVGVAGDYDRVDEMAGKNVNLLFVSTKGLLEPSAKSYRERAVAARR